MAIHVVNYTNMSVLSKYIEQQQRLKYINDQLNYYKNKQMTVEIKLLEGAKAPRYESDGAAGFDLKVHTFKKVFYKLGNFWEISEELEEVSLQSGERLLIGCGFFIAIPEGFEMQIRPRSGKAIKDGLTVINSPGTLDCDYRGEVMVCLINHSKLDVVVRREDRVAQAIVAPVEHVRFNLVNKLPETKRGSGGFGSTGNT